MKIHEEHCDHNITSSNTQSVASADMIGVNNPDMEVVSNITSGNCISLNTMSVIKSDALQ